MLQKLKDVVMTVGSSMIQKLKTLSAGFINKVRSTLQKPKSIIKHTLEKAIEGEYLGKGGIILGGTLVSGSALAAVPSGVTDAITAAATDVATVGAAVIIVMVGIKVWKWIQRAL